MNFTVAGENVYAYTGGRPFDVARPTVIFLHGGEHDHSVWVLQSRYLAHHGLGVLALDLPAHGRSGGRALTCVEDMADWLIAVLDAANVTATMLVGHSMGSLIALEAAARYPRRIDRIALLGIAFPMRVSPELLEATEKNEMLAHALINNWSFSTYAHYPSNPGPGFWAIGENLRLMQRQKPGVLNADFAACNNYRTGLERAAQVTCPTLFLLGKRDAMTPPRAAQELIRTIVRSQVVTLDDSGHNLMAEKPDEVLDALKVFLQKPAAK